MRAAALLILCLGLAACATPQQACIRDATRDQKVMDRLIAESEATLRRGYGLREVQRVEEEFVFCARGEKGAYFSCTRDEVVTRQVPVAVDLAAERRKLDSLQAERAARAPVVAARAAECRALYPE